MVKHIKEALMEGETGTKHGGEHNIIIRCVGFGHGQRCLDIFFGIMKCLTDFVSHHLPNAMQVVPEGVSIGLNLNIPQLSHILVDDAVCLCKIDDSHGTMVWIV